MTGADAMVKCLEAQGIDVVFGYPGVAIAPFYNSLYDSSRTTILCIPFPPAFQSSIQHIRSQTNV